MGERKQQPGALYSVDPEELLETIFNKMRDCGLVIVQSDKKYLTINEAAERIGVKPAHVRKLIESGELKARDFAPAGSQRRQWRISTDELFK